MCCRLSRKRSELAEKLWLSQPSAEGAPGHGDPRPLTSWGLAQLGAKGTEPAAVEVWVGLPVHRAGAEDKRARTA